MKRPLVAVTGAFLLGIAAVSYWDPPLPFLLGATSFLLALAGGLLWRGAKISRYLLLGAVFLGGALRHSGALQGGRGEMFQPFLGREVRVAGVVADEPRWQEGRGQVVLETRLILGDFPGGKPVYPIRGRVCLVARALPDLAYGDWICAAGRLQFPPAATNPGQFSLRRHWARRGLGGGFYVSPGKPLHRCQGGHGAWLPAGILRARRALTGGITRHMPGPYSQLTAQLLNSIVFGLVAAPLPPSIETPFRRAGVIHILVASGTQISLLMVFLLLWRYPSQSESLRRGATWLNEKLPPSPSKWRAALESLSDRSPGNARIDWGYSFLVLLVVGGYTLVAGAEASIVRAAVMGGLLLLARGTQRDFDGLTALAAAALGLLATNPLDLFSPAFQLSFAAVLGLMFLAPPFYKLLALRWPRWIAFPGALSGAAQLAVAPLLAYEFHQVSLIGPLANLPLLGGAGILVVTGLAASGLGLLSGTVAGWLNGLNHGLLHITMRTTLFFSGLPGSFVFLPAFSREHLIVSYGLLGLGVLAWRGKWRGSFRWERGILYVLLLLTGFAIWGVTRSLRATLQVTFLDVGNGEAILIQAPSGRTMLLDGGPYRPGPPPYDAGERVVVPALMTLGVRKLDLVVATHLQADHIGGLPAVLRALPVGHLLVSDVGEDTWAAQRLRHAAEEKKIRIRRAQRGQQIALGRGVKAYVLWPPFPPLTGSGEDANNNSVVLKLVYGRVSFLFTGDIEAPAERELLRRTGHLASTVLKVAHHGSDSSTTPEFLQEVDPQIAVISVGSQPEAGVAREARTNFQGQPAKEVRQRLAQSGVQLYRTDLEGAITIRTNGHRIRVEGYGER